MRDEGAVASDTDRRGRTLTQERRHAVSSVTHEHNVLVVAPRDQGIEVSQTQLKQPVSAAVGQ